MLKTLYPVNIVPPTPKMLDICTARFKKFATDRGFNLDIERITGNNAATLLCKFDRLIDRLEFEIRFFGDRQDATKNIFNIKPACLNQAWIAAATEFIGKSGFECQVQSVPSVYSILPDVWFAFNWDSEHHAFIKEEPNFLLPMSEVASPSSPTQAAPITAVDAVDLKKSGIFFDLNFSGGAKQERIDAYMRKIVKVADQFGFPCSLEQHGNHKIRSYVARDIDATEYRLYFGGDKYDATENIFFLPKRDTWTPQQVDIATKFFTPLRGSFKIFDGELPYGYLDWTADYRDFLKKVAPIFSPDSAESHIVSPARPADKKGCSIMVANEALSRKPIMH